MECGFCKRQVPPGTVECPYCHYRFKVDAKVLTPEERDTFEGDTINDDGSIGGNSKRNDDTHINVNTSRQDADYGGVNYIKVHNVGCSGSILTTLLILIVILALFFFLLPTFLIFAAVGAVVVFILRLFA